MNRLTSIAFDDAQALAQLSASKRLQSYPLLGENQEAILEGYANYETARGNALNILAVDVPEELKEHLRAHYAKPPKAVQFIQKLRTVSDHASCPMCGSMHSGTLDHLLPQAHYAAFVLYSRNLVPACSKCNSKRQDVLIGDAAGERILHPYFDDCLATRLVKAKFEDLGTVPRVSVELAIELTHPDYAAIAFHCRTIVRRTAIVGYLQTRWFSFCRQPNLVVRALEHNPDSPDNLQAILKKELALLDELHCGCNNWNSIFVAGLLDPDVIGWIYERMMAPGRLANASLVETGIPALLHPNP